MTSLKYMPGYRPLTPPTSSSTFNDDVETAVKAVLMRHKMYGSLPKGWGKDVLDTAKQVVMNEIALNKACGGEKTNRSISQACVRAGVSRSLFYR